MEDLKQEIKTYLEKASLKPWKLADRAGISRTSLYRFLNDERGLNLETYAKLRIAMKNNRPKKSKNAKN